LDCQTHYESLIQTYTQLKENSHHFEVIVCDLELRLTNLENHQSSFALNTDLEHLRTASATTKGELDSVKTSAAAMKTELDELRSISVSKIELNSLKLESATKAELSAVRNVLDALVADVDRTKRRSREWFPMTNPDSLNGIIASLTRRFDGNVHDRGIVTITASSLLGPECSGRNAADLNSDFPFSSALDSNAWLCYDFKDRRVSLTYYSMRSAFTRFPKSWVIEGSLNGTSWTQVDERMNTTDLKGQNRVATFPVSRIVDSHFIRLRMIGPNHSGGWYFWLSAVEFFGTLIE
jgi:hypothetical protein